MFPQTLSTSCATARPSAKFCRLSLPLGDHPSTSVNFPCGQKSLRQLSSAFCATGRPSVNFCQLSMWPVDLPPTSVSIFHVAGRTSVNCHPLSAARETLLPLCVPPRDFQTTSINFPSSPKTFRQLSVQLGDLPSTFREARGSPVKFLCSRDTIHQQSSVRSKCK